MSLSDSEELAGFEDDGAWATVVMDRYGANGTERWAYHFRGDDGSRRLVGHYYVGGCERTHFLTTFVEREGRLEHYVAIGADAPILLPIPPDARRADVDEGAYVGDPSIGFQPI